MATDKSYSEFFKADFFKPFTEFKAPAFNFDEAFSTYRRNAEALTAAGQAIAEGVQAATRRNAEVLRANVDHALKASKEIFSGTSPEAGAAKQADYAKTAFETSLSHLREVAETVNKSTYEAFDILNKRISESFEEASKTATASKKKSNA